MTEYTEEFKIFWKAYPWRWDRANSQRIKRKKKPAFLAWQKLSEEVRAECMAKRKMIRAAEGSCARDCVTWLNQEGWEDIEVESKEDKAKKAEKVVREQAQYETVIKARQEADKKAREEREKEIRARDGPALRKLAPEKLQEILDKRINPLWITRGWLIKEILAERQKK